MNIVNDQVLRGNDPFGSGAFGASRGSRKHQGTDIAVKPDQNIYSPFAGTITKYGYPYNGDLEYRYVEITGDTYKCRIMYMELDPAFEVGDFVPAQQFLGLAQNISKKYGSKMINHVHFELRLLDGTLLNPEDHLKKKV